MAQSPSAVGPNINPGMVNASAIMSWEEIQVQHDEQVTRVNIPKAQQTYQIQNPDRYLVAAVLKRFRDTKGVVHVFTTNEELGFITNDNEVQASVLNFVDELCRQMCKVPVVEKRLYLTHTDMVSKTQLKLLIDKTIGEVSYIKMFSSLSHASQNYGHSAIVAVSVQDGRKLPTTIAYNDKWEIGVALAQERQQTSEKKQNADGWISTSNSTNHRRRRTRGKGRMARACRNFIIGKPESCSYGDACQFAHNQRTGSNPSVVKGKVCFSFGENGSCVYGDECKFQHCSPASEPDDDFVQEVDTSHESMDEDAEEAGTLARLDAELLEHTAQVAARANVNRPATTTCGTPLTSSNECKVQTRQDDTSDRDDDEEQGRQGDARDSDYDYGSQADFQESPIQSQPGSAISDNTSTPYERVLGSKRDSLGRRKSVTDHDLHTRRTSLPVADTSRCPPTADVLVAEGAQQSQQ